MKIEPSLRLSVATYIKPRQLDHGLHMIKPTLRLSPFGFLYVHLTLLPHKTLIRSKGTFTVTLQKNFAFGSFQITLFNKDFAFPQANALPPVAVTPTEKMRRYINIPVRPTQWLDVAYSDNTVFASVNLIDKRGQVTMFQSIPVQPSPVQYKTRYGGDYPVVFLVHVAFAIAYYLTIVSNIFEKYHQFYKKLNTKVIVQFSLVCLGVLLLFKLCL